MDLESAERGGNRLSTESQPGGLVWPAYRAANKVTTGTTISTMVSITEIATSSTASGFLNLTVTWFLLYKMKVINSLYASLVRMRGE